MYSGVCSVTFEGDGPVRTALVLAGDDGKGEKAQGE